MRKAGDNGARASHFESVAGFGTVLARGGEEN